MEGERVPAFKELFETIGVLFGEDCQCGRVLTMSKSSAGGGRTGAMLGSEISSGNGVGQTMAMAGVS
jgi:hypothetical protein